MHNKCSVYIKVSEMEKSISFYEKFTETSAKYKERERWVYFDCGISLYCLQYDLNKIESNNFSNENFNDEYLKYVSIEKTKSSKNIVFNFSSNDLLAERTRLEKLNIGKMSEIMYVNITMPYWFFIIEDPDGNEIEITGPIND